MLNLRHTMAVAHSREGISGTRMSSTLEGRCVKTLAGECRPKAAKDFESVKQKQKQHETNSGSLPPHAPTP